jgi:hypothetical protein
MCPHPDQQLGREIFFSRRKTTAWLNYPINNLSIFDNGESTLMGLNAKPLDAVPLVDHQLSNRSAFNDLFIDHHGLDALFISELSTIQSGKKFRVNGSKTKKTTPSPRNHSGGRSQDILRCNPFSEKLRNPSNWLTRSNTHVTSRIKPCLEGKTKRDAG